MGLYTALFGFASQRYENRIERFNNKTRQIYAELGKKNAENEAELIPTTQKISRGKAPHIFIPSSVICALVCSELIVLEDIHALKQLIVAYKRDLSDVNLNGVDLSGEATDLKQAILVRADLNGVDLSHAQLSKAILIGAQLSKANLFETDLSHADLSRAVFKEARLSHANLEGAKLFEADFFNADLRKANLSKAELTEVNLFYADLVGADLREAKLRDVRLSGADFRDVNFMKAELIGAVLTGARLKGANFSGADLRRADLRHALLRETIGLTSALLDNVIVDDKTEFPDGMNIPNR